MNQNNCIIRIQNLSKKFEKKLILDDINLEIPSQGLFGIIGLNGAGKTTMIKCLLNLIPEYHGTILIGEKSSKITSSRKIISYMPERFSPNQNITGYEYIKTYSNLYKTLFELEKIHEIAKDISLDTSFLSLKIKECSKGTIQKIGILACLYVNVEVIVLDEPTSGLDIIARRSLKNAFIKHAQNKAIVFSSHILSDVEELSSQIAVVANNKIAFTGKPKQFLEEQSSNSIEEAFIKIVV